MRFYFRVFNSKIDGVIRGALFFLCLFITISNLTWFEQGYICWFVRACAFNQRLKIYSRWAYKSSRLYNFLQLRCMVQLPPKSYLIVSISSFQGRWRRCRGIANGAWFDPPCPIPTPTTWPPRRRPTCGRSTDRQTTARKVRFCCALICCGYIWTHWGRDKMAAVSQTTL